MLQNRFIRAIACRYKYVFLKVYEMNDDFHRIFKITEKNILLDKFVKK